MTDATTNANPTARDDFYAAMDAHVADWLGQHGTTEGATASWEETEEFKRLYSLAFDKPAHAA